MELEDATSSPRNYTNLKYWNPFSSRAIFFYYFVRLIKRIRFRWWAGGGWPVWELTGTRNRDGNKGGEKRGKKRMEEIPWQGGEARRYFWNRKTPSSSPLPSSGIRNTCVCQRLELSLSLSLSIPSLEFIEISPRPASPLPFRCNDIPRPFSSQRERKHTCALRVSNNEDYEDRWRNGGEKSIRASKTVCPSTV